MFNSRVQPEGSGGKRQKCACIGKACNSMGLYIDCDSRWAIRDNMVASTPTVNWRWIWLPVGLWGVTKLLAAIFKDGGSKPEVVFRWRFWRRQRDFSTERGSWVLAKANYVVGGHLETWRWETGSSFQLAFWASPSWICNWMGLLTGRRLKIAHERPFSKMAEPNRK
jgi:hypothetical protein